MIETLLIVVLFVLVIAMIASFLPIDARAKQVLWVLVLIVIAFWITRQV